MFIVYTYTRQSITKYILGIYETLLEASQRQRSYYNQYRQHEECVVFINEIPEGKCKVELFTTLRGEVLQ